MSNKTKATPKIVKMVSRLLLVSICLCLDAMYDLNRLENRVKERERLSSQAQEELSAAADIEAFFFNDDMCARIYNVSDGTLDPVYHASGCPIYAVESVGEDKGVILAQGEAALLFFADALPCPECH